MRAKYWLQPVINTTKLSTFHGMAMALYAKQHIKINITFSFFFIYLFMFLFCFLLFSKLKSFLFLMKTHSWMCEYQRLFTYTEDYSNSIHIHTAHIMCAYNHMNIIHFKFKLNVFYRGNGAYQKQQTISSLKSSYPCVLLLQLYEFSIYL